MKTSPGVESDDRLENAANQTTRSYVTVNRPSGQANTTQTNRPRTHPGTYYCVLIENVLLAFSGGSRISLCGARTLVRVGALVEHPTRSA